MIHPYTHIRIVGDAADADFEELRPPERLRDEVLKLHAAAVKGKPWVVEKLRQQIRHFPKYPVFKNLLYLAYLVQNKEKAAREVAEQMYREHPEYVYARANLAESLSDLPAEIGRIPEILHPSLNITALFPNRKAFHFGEYIVYERSVIRYLARSGATEEALNRHRLLNESGYAEPEVLTALLAYIEAHQPFDPELPTLHTPNLEVLYFAGPWMLPEVARDILAQPRETLVADLCRILDDLTDRADYWIDEDFLPGYGLQTPVHAMILLAELGAEEALPSVLRFLRQPEEDIEYWLGDYTTEVLPEIVARFASPAQYERLAEFATDTGIDEFISNAAIAGVVHRAKREPALKPAATDWLAGILEKLLPEAKPDERNGHLDMALSAIIDLQAESLLPLAEKCFQLKLVDLSMAGPYPEYLAIFREEDPWRDHQNYPDLDGVYNFVNGFWGNVEEDELPPALSGNGWMEQIRAAAVSRLQAEAAEKATKPAGGTPFETEKPLAKVSLNDPCPCGSGKKYKRCCGKEK